MDKSIEVFICYDSNDSAVAREYQQKLNEAGISANIDGNFIHAGDDWKNRIIDMILNCDVAMLILTKNIKKNSFVVKELEQIIACGIPLIPFAPDGFGDRTSLSEEEKRILEHPIGNGQTIGEIQYTNNYDEALFALQQRAYEHKAHKRYRNKRGTSAKEFMQYLFTGYLANTEGPFNLLLLSQYPQNSSTQHLVTEITEEMRRLYANSSLCIIPLELRKAYDSVSNTTLKKCLNLADGVVIIDTGESGDFSMVEKWSEHRANINKPIMRYVPPAIKAEKKQSDKLKRYEEIESISQLASLLRVASVRSNKSVLYLRRINTTLLLMIALIIISAIIGFGIYNHNEGKRVTSALSYSNSIYDFTNNIVFGSSDNKCNIIFFKGTPDNNSIKQFFSKDTLKYDKEISIIGATMKCAEVFHSPFYIVWERTPQLNEKIDNKCHILFAAYKDNTGEFKELPDSCIRHSISGTIIIIDGKEIPVKYQTGTPNDNQKQFVACFVQPAVNGTMTGLSFELSEHQYDISIKNKLLDINCLNRISAAAKLINWINVFHDETLEPFTSQLSKSEYDTLCNNLVSLFNDGCRISLFYEKKDSIFYLYGKKLFGDKNNNIGAAMQAPNWYICYDEGKYIVGKKDKDKIIFHKQSIFINEDGTPFFKLEDKKINLVFSKSTTASEEIKLLVSTAIRKDNKIMGISVDYSKSEYNEEYINSIAERAYAALEIVFNAYSDRIPDTR